MAPIVWTGLDRILDNAQRYLESVELGAFEAAQYIAPQIESDMKADAPWTDRTANARQGLWCVALRTDDAVIIHAAHSMDYGLYLEVSHAGRYSIILPTLEQYYPRVLELLKRGMP